jgi:antitoxin VapB
MALTIENPEADQLARELAGLTGESTTDVVLNSLRERLEREKRKREDEDVLRRVREIQNHIKSLPLLDTRSDDEILGYDASGLPA